MKLTVEIGHFPKTRLPGQANQGKIILWKDVFISNKEVSILLRCLKLFQNHHQLGWLINFIQSVPQNPILLMTLTAFFAECKIRALKDCYI